MEETAEQEAVSMGDARGKHRILAELGRAQEEVLFLEKEVEELEHTDTIETVCDELISVIEKAPDPLLPLTSGPFNLQWDRWFEGPNGGEDCCRSCFIL
ncbi:unnamed protein product [Cochlearia groenlandica]